MKRSFVWAALLLGFGCGEGKSAAGETNIGLRAYQPAHPGKVEILRFDWEDKKRNRSVPAKVYFPQTGSGPFPVIIFSHGLGGSREGYEYLGQEWASRGYVSVHLQHLGSDSGVWQSAPLSEMKQNMRKSAMSLENSINRPLDVSFAIDEMERLNGEAGPLKGRLDLQRVGVAGHSYGAFTTLAVAGQTFAAPAGGSKASADPRVKAGIAMSAPVPALKSRWDQAFNSIQIPIFHMTGTLDDSPIGDTKAPDRRVPYDHITRADQFLVTFTDGDHMIFSGRGRVRGGEKDTGFQELIKAGSTAFWEAYLKNDAVALQWLGRGGFKSALGTNGVFESKLGK